MARFFNAFGPIFPERHYAVPPLARLPLAEIEDLIGKGLCLAIQGPAQWGKTTCLLALTELLNQEHGAYGAVYLNLESAGQGGADLWLGMRTVLSELTLSLERDLNLSGGGWYAFLEQHGPLNALRVQLVQAARQSKKPLVLCFDGIDTLGAELLTAVFRQIRSGMSTSSAFPLSVVFGGTSDVRGLFGALAGDVPNGSCSDRNFCARSFVLPPFSLAQVKQLFLQHARESGQKFSQEGLEMVYELTQGHPRLVNAMAHEVSSSVNCGGDDVAVLTEEVMTEGKEHLLNQRQTYFDWLAGELRHERVHRILDPVLAGETGLRPGAWDDMEHLVGLGLVTLEDQPKIANRIFGEVIPREVMRLDRFNFSRETLCYHTVDLGHLDSVRMMRDFQTFYGERGIHWLESCVYQEAGPLLLFQAFLQSVMNDGGRLEREYGWGKRGVDLFLFWPTQVGVQTVVIELRNLRGRRIQTLQESADQTSRAMDLCGSDEGHLILFDRGSNTPLDEKVYHTTEVHKGRTIHIWGM